MTTQLLPTTPLPLVLTRVLVAPVAMAALGSVGFGGWWLFDYFSHDKGGYAELALYFGGMMLAGGLPALALAALALFSRRPRRAAVGGLLLALGVCAIAVPIGTDYAPWPFVGLVVALPLMATSVWTLSWSRSHSASASVSTSVSA